VIACFWLIARTTEMTVSAEWILAGALILIGRRVSTQLSVLGEADV
jgi:hypothetical protein